MAFISKAEYRKGLAEKYGSVDRSVDAFLDKISDGDLVWIRNKKQTYYLGRVASEWSHWDGSSDYERHDIGNIRRCEWIVVKNADDVPGRVRNAFIPRKTVQPVADGHAIDYSRLLFARLHGEPIPADLDLKKAGIFSLLSHEDMEDVVACYLQIIENCVMFPSTHKRSTPLIEGTMASRKDGRRVGYQVKSGAAAISYSDYEHFNGTVYLFALNRPDGVMPPNCIWLDADAVRAFVRDYKRFLPGVVQTWQAVIDEAGR